MRLLEVAPDFVRSETGTLLTILQHVLNRHGTGVKVPFQSVIGLMNNAGYSFSYDDFKSIYDSTPSVKNIIATFSETELTLKDADDADVAATGDMGADAEKKSNIVDKMAKSAASKQ
jgi:hypothetical protein